jgi:SecD/SecF fusion protein
MSRRAASVVLLAVAGALVALALLAIPSSPFHKKATLGLDLQGGLEVTLKAVPPKNRPLTEEDLTRSVTIMQNRVDKLGVAEPNITKQGEDQIAIQLPGIKDPAAAADVIGKTAQLELLDLEENLRAPSVSVDGQGNPVATPTIYALLAGQQALVKNGQSDGWYLFDKNKKLVVGPVATADRALKKFDGKVPAGYKLFGTPVNMAVISCPAGQFCPGATAAEAEQRLYYLVRYEPPTVPEMTGADLKLSGTRQDFDTSPGGGGRPIVTMQFTNKGADKFADITRTLAVRGKQRFNLAGGQGQADFYNQHFAIVLDREIRSWPSIDFTENPSGISGTNGAIISGDFSIKEAKDLALVLQTGALPVKFVTLDQTTVSATLGKDSLNEAKIAGVIGLLLVAFFLIVFYRFLGLIAVTGLAIYAALLYLAVLAFNVTLTLPGIAGLVLTLGVAADANVVIFERVKEEYRAGRSMRAAISQGYTKGFHTIIDANAVTAITALVLFAVATASVRGFALMLLIGTAVSMLTAVLVTRAMLTLLAGFSWIDNPRLMGSSGRGIPRWLKADFIGRRNLWFGISATVVVISLGALAINGLNLGIDFKGGTQVDFKTSAPVALEDVRSQAEEIGQEGAVIQGRGPATGDSYTSFQIRTSALTTAEIQSLQTDLERTVNAESFNSKSVSASFGRQIARSAILAIIVSLLLIVGYISLRFEWKFALPVIIALAHDIIITVGIYALVGREVTTATVAAILTVLGYSIYDTIIIFDRIRENIPLMRRASMKTISNVSLWETIPRSLATTFITLLPILSLFVFGGATLKDFAFALLIGIGSGAYSSIFVAAPLVYVFKSREPEYARRGDTDEAVGSVGSAAVTSTPEPAAAEPGVSEEPVPVAAGTAGAPARPAGDPSKRDQRRERRNRRPHGRAR